MVLKDIKHLLGLGQEANLALKNALTGRAYLQKVIKRSPGDQIDVSAIYGAVREANGLEFKNQDLISLARPGQGQKCMDV